MAHALHLNVWEVVQKDGAEKLKKTLDRHFVVTSIELNPEIDDDELELSFPAGTLVNNGIAPRIYRLRDAWRYTLRRLAR
jgi:hypothetical protein